MACRVFILSWKECVWNAFVTCKEGHSPNRNHDTSHGTPVNIRVALGSSPLCSRLNVSCHISNTSLLGAWPFVAWLFGITPLAFLSLVAFSISGDTRFYIFSFARFHLFGRKITFVFLFCTCPHFCGLYPRRLCWRVTKYNLFRRDPFMIGPISCLSSVVSLYLLLFYIYVERSRGISGPVRSVS